MQLATPPEDTPEERLFRPGEVAALWGVSRSFVSKEAAAGRLGFIPFGTKGDQVHRRFSLAHIRAYVAERDHPARKSA